MRKWKRIFKDKDWEQIALDICRMLFWPVFVLWALTWIVKILVDFGVIT